MSRILEDPESKDIERLKLVPYIPNVDTIFSPDWRWDIINSAVNGEDIGRVADECVGAGVKFLRAWRAAGSSIARINSVVRRFPSELAAYKMYVSDDALPKWYTEALILAGEDIDKIAKFLYTNINTIDTYEKLFFDLRDKLNADGFVLSNVVRFQIGSTAIQTRDYVWKAIGFFGGVDVLYDYWSLRPAKSEATDLYMMESMHSLIKRTAIERSILYENDWGKEIPELPIGRYLRYLESMIRKQELDQTIAVDTEITDLAEVVEAITIKIARRSDLADGSILEQGASELRANELVDLAKDESLAQLLQTGKLKGAK